MSKTEVIYRTAPKVPVDAGIILVCDQDYYRKWGSTGSPSPGWGNVFKIPKGLYTLQWSIKGTWLGDVSGSGTLKVTSGAVTVSDPCYLVLDDLWGKILKHTNFFKHPDSGTVVLDKMGGDGVYKVDLTFVQKAKRKAG